jgi:hypothetical protein
MEQTTSLSTASASASSSSSSSSPADIKISNDLIILKEKMDLLDSMLNNPNDLASPKLSVLTNDSIRSVIGYLDSCSPRMIELVTACTSTSFGVLSEEVFGDVLGCNDRLQKLLTDVDTRILIETPAMTTAASASGTSPGVGDAAAEAEALAADNDDDPLAAAAAAAANELTVTEELFGDLLLGNEDPFADAHGSSSGVASAGGSGGTTTTEVVAAGAKTTGETSDDFKLPATTTTTTTANADEVTTGTDPFDDFFAERTTSDN